MGRRDTLLLSILTLVTALAWIAFDVYHASVDSTIPQEIEAQLVPITPKFNRSIVNSIKSRQDVEPLITGTIRAVTPTRAPTPLPSSPSASTNTATNSGGL